MFVLLHVWMFIWPLTGCFLECKDGNQRNEISSLFNALLLWDISICGAIFQGLDPFEFRRVQERVVQKKKKHGVKRKERKRASEVGDSGWAAGNTY